MLKTVLWRGNPARARQVKVTCLHDQSLRRLTAGPLNYAISSSLLALRRFCTRLCVYCVNKLLFDALADVPERPVLAVGGLHVSDTLEPPCYGLEYPQLLGLYE